MKIFLKKRKIVLYLSIMIIAFLFLSLSGNNGDTHDSNPKGKIELVAQRSNEVVFEELLEEIEEVILSSNNEMLQNILALTYDKIKNGELKIVIQDKITSLPFSKLGNAAFQYNVGSKKRQNPTLLIETKLFRFYPKNKSLIMGIIIHELTHAYMYYNDYDTFIGSKDSDLEGYLYEMDSLYAEAQFFELCKKRRMPLTKFEKFLIKSVRKDNLEVASQKIYKTDNGLVWYLIHAKNDVLNKKITHKEYFKLIQDHGEDLLSRWEHAKGANEWEQYKICIEMFTFSTYMGVIANQCLTQEAINDLKNEIDVIIEIQQRCYQLVVENYNIVEDYHNDFFVDLFSDVK